MPPELLTTLVSVGLSALVACFMAERAARREFERDVQRVRTEFMAEKVARDLLSDPRWKKRSFEEIKKRLGGFEDDELRKLLVRAGAIRFYKNSGEELWGLRERNPEED